MSDEQQLQLSAGQLEQLDFAERNTLIAYKLLLYFPNGEQEAALHLLRGWSGLARMWKPGLEAIAPEAALDDMAGILPRGFDVARCREEIAKLSRSTTLLESGTAVPADTALSALDLNKQCGLLFEVIRGIKRKLRRQRRGAQLKRIPRRVLLSLLGIGLLGAAAWGIIRLLTPVPPWQASFFLSLDLTGPIVGTLNYDTIDFEWSNVSPLSTMPGERFSLRLDTCLTLDGPEQVNLQLGTDDGGKLFVDGEEVIAMWGQHGLTSERFSRQLAAGAHHLRIEYFQDGGAAQLILKGSLGAEPIGELPHSKLKAPKIWTDGSVSCRGE